MYKTNSDLFFFIDRHRCWYHKGIKDITNNIFETVLYLNKIIEDGNYEKVIFMGISAGGYAAILFGSLCNVSNVIAFIPQTILKNPINVNFSNLKTIINKKTNYILYGDLSVSNVDDNHHISHCENLDCFPNVKILKNKKCNLKELRDGGFIKTTIDEILFGG